MASCRGFCSTEGFPCKCLPPKRFQGLACMLWFRVEGGGRREVPPPVPGCRGSKRPSKVQPGRSFLPDTDLPPLWPGASIRPPPLSSPDRGGGAVGPVGGARADGGGAPKSPPPWAEALVPRCPVSTPPAPLPRNHWKYWTDPRQKLSSRENALPPFDGIVRGPSSATARPLEGRPPGRRSHGTGLPPLPQFLLMQMPPLSICLVWLVLFFLYISMSRKQCLSFF